MASSTIIASTLRKHQKKILGEWVQTLHGDSADSKKARISPQELNVQAEEFLQPDRHGCGGQSRRSWHRPVQSAAGLSRKSLPFPGAAGLLFRRNRHLHLFVQEATVRCV